MRISYCPVEQAFLIYMGQNVCVDRYRMHKKVGTTSMNDQLIGASIVIQKGKLIASRNPLFVGVRVCWLQGQFLDLIEKRRMLVAWHFGGFVSGGFGRSLQRHDKGCKLLEYIESVFSKGCNLSVLENSIQ